MFTPFKRRDRPLISLARFMLRMAAFGATAIGLDALLIVNGAVGFHSLERTGWLSSAVNAAMILTGNSPLYRSASQASELFQMLYAVIGGIGFVVVATVILAPAVHRVLHIFQLGVQDVSGRKNG